MSEIEEIEEIDRAYQDYQKDYERRKNEILSKIETIKNSDLPVHFRMWLDQVSKFIKEEK